MSGWGELTNRGLKDLLRRYFIINRVTMLSHDEADRVKCALLNALRDKGASPCPSMHWFPFVGWNCGEFSALINGKTKWVSEAELRALKKARRAGKPLLIERPSPFDYGDFQQIADIWRRDEECLPPIKTKIATCKSSPPSSPLIAAYVKLTKAQIAAATLDALKQLGIVQ
jgi:hypothetical protein